MTDILLTAYLTALASDDVDTAREVASLADDPDAVDALLSDDGVSESYTPDEYELLTEAARSGLVLKAVGTHPRTGKPIMRYVRATQKVSVKDQKAQLRAESKAKARAMIERGIKGPAQARVLAGHLKNLTVEDAKELAAAHSARLAGRLKADKVANLVAFAQGRGSVERGTPTPTPTPEPVPAPRPAAGRQSPPQADLESAVMSEFKDLLNEEHTITGMVPIHQVRDRIRAKFGDEAASHKNFNEVVLNLWRQGKLRMHSLEDAGAATLKQRQDSIPGVGETLFYLELPNDSRVS